MSDPTTPEDREALLAMFPPGVPYPPNPPENPPHPFIPGSPGWLAYERGRAAADSWWRERLTSDETVEAVAMAYEPDSFIGDAPYADDALRDARRVIEAALRSLLPVNEPEIDT